MRQGFINKLLSNRYWSVVFDNPYPIGLGFQVRGKILSKNGKHGYRCAWLHIYIFKMEMAICLTPNRLPPQAE